MLVGLPPSPTTFLRYAAPVLLALGAIYWLSALVLFHSGGFADTSLRIHEQLQLSDGEYPAGGYPPWSLAIYRFVTFEYSDTATRISFSALNIIGLSFIIWLISSRYKSHDFLVRLFLVSSFVAIFADFVCIRRGHISIAIVAAIMAVALTLEKKRFALSGLFLFLSFIKPQMVMYHVLLAVYRRHLVVLAVFSALILLSSAYVFALVGVDAVTTLFNKTVASTDPHGSDVLWRDARFGVLDFLFRVGLPHTLTVASSIVIGAGVAAVLLARSDNLSPMAIIGILCVLNLTFMYHRRYDVMLLWPFFLAVFEHWLNRGDVRAFWLAIAVGFTMWIPHTDAMFHSAVIYYAFQLFWLAAAATFVYFLKSPPKAARS